MSDGVKIAWFTPLSTRSAIGEFSAHVTAALAEFAEVEIWTSDDPPHHQTDLQVIAYSQDSAHLQQLLPMKDAVVYNMGDYLPFHQHMHAVAQRFPGVVVLHDRVLHHLFAGMWLTGPQISSQTYVQRMRAYYGEEGAEVAASSLEGRRPPVWESDAETLEYPLFEEALLGALGAVTHSQVQAEQVKACWVGPVRALHLPCYETVLRGTSGMPRERSDERLRLLTFGHLNPNKQVHRVVEMIAADRELAAKVQYTVVGPDDGFKDYVDDLRELIMRNPHAKVDILGWRSDEELHRLMEQADVFVNLRHPVMEGGSASLMRQLAYGRPILCFGSGLFDEIPAGNVARVPAGDFLAAGEALRDLAMSPDRRRALGERARALAASYDERTYAEGLLELVEESRRATPALRLLDVVARELGSMGVSSRLPIFDDIAKDFSRVLAL